jgi:drug/metabolite transporter (DMT)-like permease
MQSLRQGGLSVSFVLVWSSGYLVGALATAVIAPLTVTFWRFVLAAAVLAAIARWRHEHWPSGWRSLARVSGVGVVLFAVQFGGLYIGLADGMPAGTTALIACSAPLLVAVAGAGLGWERLAAVQWAGIALGVVGVVVTLADRVGRPPSVAALLWTLLGLAGLAAGTLLQRTVSRAAGPAALASTQVAAAAVVLAVWAPLRGSLAIPVTTQAVVSFLWLALVAGVGAPLLLFALIARRGPTGGTSLLFAVPAVTALAAWPLLGTPVHLTAVVGLLVAAVGLWLSRRAPRRGRPDTGSPVDRTASPVLVPALRHW